MSVTDQEFAEIDALLAASPLLESSSQDAASTPFVDASEASTDATQDDEAPVALGGEDDLSQLVTELYGAPPSPKNEAKGRGTGTEEGKERRARGDDEEEEEEEDYDAFEAAAPAKPQHKLRRDPQGSRRTVVTRSRSEAAVLRRAKTNNSISGQTEEELSINSYNMKRTQRLPASQCVPEILGP